MKEDGALFVNSDSFSMGKDKALFEGIQVGALVIAFFLTDALPKLAYMYGGAAREDPERRSLSGAEGNIDRKRNKTIFFDMGLDTTVLGLCFRRRHSPSSSSSSPSLGLFLSPLFVVLFAASR